MRRRMPALLGTDLPLEALSDERAEFSVVCGVAHDHLQVFLVELFSTVFVLKPHMVLGMSSDKRCSLSP